MTPTANDYLHRCLQAFPDLCLQKYGVAFELSTVERDLEHLRSRKSLTYDDVLYFESQDRWVFKNFWVLPPEAYLRPALEKLSITFWRLPDDEERVVRDLVHAFKSLDLASIVLRFVRPDHYAIISTPVRHLLELGSGSDLVETYGRYLENLREIGKKYRFSRVADVDMALWGLHEKCYGTFKDAEIQSAFEADTFMMRVRARNLVSPIAALSDARLASALSDVKPELASLIACYTLEILVREIGRIHGVTAKKLAQVIEEIPSYGSVDALRKGQWESLKRVRDELLHDGRQPTAKQRDRLVDEVLRLERDLQEIRREHAAGEQGGKGRK